MVIIKLYDYWDEWSWCWCGVGMGNNDAASIGAQIDAAVANKEDIEVHINSGGGSVYDGFNIYNALVAAKKYVNVDTYNMGICASIASIIFLAGNNRKVAKASLFMIHKPTIDMFWFGSMNAEELKREAEALDKIQGVLVSLYIEATGMTEEIVNTMIDRTTWLTPLECEMQGFATEVISGAIVKSDIPEEVLTHVQEGAPQDVLQYSNRFFNNVKTNKNRQNMKKEAQDALNESKGLIKQFNNLLEKVLGKKTKNVTLVLKDGTEVFTMEDLAVGISVYSDSEMTVLVDDNTYVLSDDSEFTTVDGVVTEITPAPEAEAEAEDTVLTVESLTAENTALKTKIALLTAENSVYKKDQATLISSLTASNAAMNKLAKASSTYVPPAKKETFIKNEETPVNGDRKPKFSLPKKENKKV